MKNTNAALGLTLLLLAGCASGVGGVGSAEESRFSAIHREYRNADSNYVLVVAHRGDWRGAPENSIASIKNCIEMGADMVELDVRMTKDGHPVILHDYTVNRTTNGKGAISELTLAEAKALRLKHKGLLTFEQIPTLAEAMNVARGQIMVNIDSKGTPFAKTYKVLQETDTVAHALFKSGASLASLKTMLAPMPKDINMMVIRRGGNDKSFAELHTLLEELSVRPTAFEFTSLDKKSAYLTKELLSECRKNGARVWINTLWSSQCAGYTDAKSLKNPDANWGYLIEQGFNMIQTDSPRELLKYLRAKGLHN